MPLFYAVAKTMMRPWRATCTLFTALLLTASLAPAVPARAASQGGSVFLRGNFLEVGIAPQGWFGPPAQNAPAVPTGFHNTSPAGLGFVADFQQDGWEQGTPPYGGDYIVSGSPYEGFAVRWTAGGSESFFCQGNDICGPNFTSLSLTETSSGDTLSAVWVGEAQAGGGQSLRLTHTIFFVMDDLFITIDTRLENTGSVPLQSLEFLRGLDPDNDSAWPGGDFDTANAVLHQPGEGGNLDRALVRAAGTIYPDMLLFLGAADSRARASIDRDWTMDPQAVLDDPDAGPRLADEALALAWRFGTLEPGVAVDISYFYAFGTQAQAEALLEAFSARLCTGTVMTLYGGTASAGGWTVSVPPAAVPAGACLELDLRDPASGPAAGAGMKPLLHLVEARIIAPDGSQVTHPALPVQICYTYNDADLTAVRGNPASLLLGNAATGAPGWTFHPPSVYPAERKVCAGISDFGYFEVFTPTVLPSTGFAPGQATMLAAQPLEKAYAVLSELWLEIPRLEVQARILGVPLNGGWDVSWLGENVGWLEGTAFPTLKGNSALTGHVWGAVNQPGPFAALNTLWFGDKVIIHAWGQEYIYEVRSIRQVEPEETGAMLEPEELPWLTLVTCRGWDETSGAYRWRVLVRAVLVEVK